MLSRPTATAVEDCAPGSSDSARFSQPSFEGVMPPLSASVPLSSASWPSKWERLSR